MPAVVLLLLAAPGLAAARLPPTLEGLPRGTEVSVILRLSDPLGATAFRKGDRRQAIVALKARALASQRPLRQLLSSRRVRRQVPLWLVNGLAVTAPIEVIRELAGRPEVEAVALDGLLASPAPGEASPAAPEWNLAAIHAPELWSLGHTGAGVVVASLDTGVDGAHSDLAGSWRGGGNSWFDPYGEHATPYDAHGHGTQAMGLIVGAVPGGPALGVAPGARWIAVKIYDDAGSASLSAIHQGFEWLLDPDGDPATDDAPQVVNASWGFEAAPGQCVSEFTPDVQFLRAAGIAVVASAGNGGPAPFTSTSPANYSETLAVGAVDATSTAALFSARGPSACDGALYPRLVAPGVAVRTADLTAGGVFPSSYTSVSGTSFAAPHVSGALALLKSALAGASLSELEAALARSAVDLGPAGPESTYGHGLIDVLAAYRLLAAAPVCTDEDHDGFAVEARCGATTDCDDLASAVHPGALEVKRDGIDQDCDGFDLSIEVRSATCSRKRVLGVVATSNLGAAAHLSVEGHGPMVWDAARARWWFSGRGLTSRPWTVTVRGVEGSVSAPVSGP